MALAFYQFTALIKTDVAGRNAIANQALTVNISGGGLATIYSDAAGTTPIVQPGAQTDSDGNFVFYAESGGYDIVSGGRTETVNLRDTDDLIGYEPTVTSLKSRPVVVGDVVRVGERASGIFKAKSGLIDNGRNIIQSTFDVLIFWELQPNQDGSFDIAQYGANGNPSTDPATIQACIDDNDFITAPPGTFYAKNINFPISEGKTFKGSGQNTTIFINDSGSGENTFNLVGIGSLPGTRVAYQNLSGFALIGKTSAGHGIFTDLSYENSFEKIKIRGFEGSGKDGLHIKRGFYSKVTRVTVQECGRAGIYFGETGNGNQMSYCHLGGSPHEGNGLAGVIVTSDGGGVRTHGVMITNNVFESNIQHNILIDDADGVVVGDNYIEHASGYYKFYYDNEINGPFTVGEPLTWAGGTGTLSGFTDEGTTGLMTIFLNTGSAPIDNDTITGGTSTATCDVNGTPATGISQVKVDSSTANDSIGTVIRDNDFTGDVECITIANSDNAIIKGNDIGFGMTVSSTATGTKVLQQQNFSGTFTENGEDTEVAIDKLQSDRWYTKKGFNKVYSVLVGAGFLDIDAGTGEINLTANSQTTTLETNGDVTIPNGLAAGGDTGGVAGKLTYTGSENTATPRGSGVGTVKFADGVNRDNIGFVTVRLQDGSFGAICLWSAN